MFLSLILGALAGWAARPLEPRLTDIHVVRIGADFVPDAPGRRVAALIVTTTIAAVFLALLNVHGPVLLFVLGAGLGHFQAELREFWLSRQG